MNKRKRVQDHEPRARPSPVDQEKARLRRSVVEIGEPSRTKVDEVLREIADAIESAHEEVRPPVLQTISAVVYEQPHKIPLLGFLIDLVNRKLPSFSRTAIEMAHTGIVDSLTYGDYRRLDLLLRFVASISVVDGESLDELIADLAERAVEIAHLPLGHRLFSGAVFAALHRVNTGVAMPERVEKALLAFEPVVNGDSSDIVPFYGDKAPYTAQPAVVLLAAAVKEAHAAGWPTDYLLKAESMLPPLIESDSQEKHRFAAVQVAPAAELVPSRISRHEALRPPVWTQIYLPKNGVHSVPEPTTLFAHLLRDVAAANIAHIDFNRKEVTRQLITLDLFFNSTKFAPPGVAFDELAGFAEGRATVKVEDVALEAVLDEMLRLPASGFPTVYFDTILIEACVMAPQAIAPVLGRALRFLFENCETLDAEVLFRVTEWFAHHMSNFGFTWKWNEWVDALQLPVLHPKQVFMRELIVKQVRLSYPQRVRDVLPQEFAGLVPDVPDMPPFAYAGDEQVEAFVAAAQESAERGLAAFGPLKDAITAKKIGQAAADLDKAISHTLVCSICHLGARSVTHAATWVKQLGPLVRENVRDETLVVAAVMDFWKDQPWVGGLVLDQFVGQDLVSSATIARYVVEHPSLLVSNLGWELLGRYNDGLEDLKLDVDEWWNSRLHKALVRRKAAQAAQRQLAAAEAAESAAPAPVPSAAPDTDAEVSKAKNEDMQGQTEPEGAPDVNQIKAEQSLAPSEPAEQSLAPSEPAEQNLAPSEPAEPENAEITEPETETAKEAA